MQLLTGRFLLSFFPLLWCLNSLGAEQVDFETEIAPILAEHCVRCHSPNNRKGDLSLSTARDLRDGGYLSPGDPSESQLMDLIVAEDGEAPRMPQDAEPLSAEHVALLRQWIKQGARWEDDFVIREASKADTTWWSLQPLAVKDLELGIDDFISSKLKEQNLQRNPPADRVTLIRRATFDLTGLPPTPEEVDEFVNDRSPMPMSD